MVQRSKELDQIIRELAELRLLEAVGQLTTYTRSRIADIEITMKVLFTDWHPPELT